MKKVFGAGAGAFVSLISTSAFRWLLEGVCGASNVTPMAPFGKLCGRRLGAGLCGPGLYHPQNQSAAPVRLSLCHEAKAARRSNKAAIAGAE